MPHRRSEPNSGTSGASFPPCLVPVRIWTRQYAARTMRAMDPRFFFARNPGRTHPSAVFYLHFRSSGIRGLPRATRFAVNPHRQLIGVINTIAGGRKLDPGVHQMFRKFITAPFLLVIDIHTASIYK